MNYAIETQGLTKIYKNIRAVDSLSIHVPEGKIYGFLGKNGAGKTTTIKMIMGLIRPDEGGIMVFGKDAGKDRLWAARKIGSIVETPGFYENLPARNNLEITVNMFNVNKKRIDEVLEIVGLRDTGKKKVKEFSLGMKQRLGIANALVHSPSVLILDEPTNGLDPAGIKDMRDFLKELSQEHNITVLISSHILSEVQILADYVGIIDQGRLMDETDIQTIKAEEQSYLHIEVDRPEEAARLIKEMELKYEIENKKLMVYCSRDINCNINRNLVLKGINVSNLTPVYHSLEERFLTITSGKSA
ncbi:MAG: ABC transporter ATP-binding protein [Bacillota bacterium]|nr:ABC transporter ATP-binding protein [Bacillota bacterium]